MSNNKSNIFGINPTVPEQSNVHNSKHSDKRFYKDLDGQLYELKAISDLKMEMELVSRSNSICSSLPSYHASADGDDDRYSANSRKNPILFFQLFLDKTCTDYSTILVRITLFALFCAYTAYLTCAILYNFDLALPLIICTAVVVACIVYVFIRDHFGDLIYRHCMKPIGDVIMKFWPVLKWFVYPAIIITIILYLGLVVIEQPKQTQSILGFVIFTLFIYVTSKHPNRIIWRPIVWGFLLQFIFATIVLRTEWGYAAIKFLADQINVFIEYGYDGAAVVFGDPTMLLHPFAMMGMPLLIYLGSVMAILYYTGLTQQAALKVGWLMQVSMGTTAIETLNTAANIFLDGMDTMLMLRHYIDKLTFSEFNCFVVGNHATVAGFVFALFVLFGAPPQHLLSAAVMSAPATIAICKLNYPETEESITKNLDDIKLPKGEEISIFEAAANGCSVAARVVGSVMACYIAFIGLLSFLNATLAWLGARVGVPQLTFELICSFVMWPIAYIIGVDAPECKESAKLIGIKIFATEILAYQELGISVKKGLLNPRNQALTTYAMCGFSSVSTIAIAVGVWQAVCPQRCQQMASHILRVLVEANISCFMTAAVAGIFYSEEVVMNFDTNESGPWMNLGTWLLGLIPSYKTFMSLADF